MTMLAEGPARKFGKLLAGPINCTLPRSAEAASSVHKATACKRLAKLSNKGLLGVALASRLKQPRPARTPRAMASPLLLALATELGGKALEELEPPWPAAGPATTAAVATACRRGPREAEAGLAAGASAAAPAAAAPVLTVT